MKDQEDDGRVHQDDFNQYIYFFKGFYNVLFLMASNFHRLGTGSGTRLACRDALAN